MRWIGIEGLLNDDVYVGSSPHNKFTNASLLYHLYKENGIQEVSWVPFFVDISRFFDLFHVFENLMNFYILHENI